MRLNEMLLMLVPLAAVAGGFTQAAVAQHAPKQSAILEQSDRILAQASEKSPTTTMYGIYGKREGDSDWTLISRAQDYEKSLPFLARACHPTRGYKIAKLIDPDGTETTRDCTAWSDIAQQFRQEEFERAQRNAR